MRTHEHKLIYYDGMAEQPEENRWELYDLANDPQETTNVYHDPQHSPVIKRLKRALTQLQTDLGDQP